MADSLLCGGLPSPTPLDLGQAMAGARVKIEAVKRLELMDTVERSLAEWRLAVKGMQHDAFEHVPQGHVVVLGKGFQDFENALFHAHAGLDAFHQKFGIAHMVPMYHGT